MHKKNLTALAISTATTTIIVIKRKSIMLNHNNKRNNKDENIPLDLVFSHIRAFQKDKTHKIHMICSDWFFNRIIYSHWKYQLSTLKIKKS